MLEKLETLVQFLRGDTVTQIFCGLIAVLFLMSVVWARAGKAGRFVASTPNLLISIGILGTFLGIVIGLLEFDVGNINKSITDLLEGLKIAFFTSIFGMAFSILFKLLTFTPFLMRQTRAAGEDIGTALLDSMVSQGKQLKSLHSAIAGDEDSSIAGQIKLFRHDAKDRHDVFAKKFSDALLSQEARLKALHSAIVGDEESSLAGQIKLFRGDMRDRHDAFAKELWGRLTEFTEMMSKSATEQVIDALKNVIADFNAKLTEQFGENFKTLDAAVHRLVEWQENYRVQLEKMSEQYKQGVEAITQTEASIARISEALDTVVQRLAEWQENYRVQLEKMSEQYKQGVDALTQVEGAITHISESAKTIPQAMDDLKTILQVNQHQIDELDRHLSAFADVRDKAVEAVPELHKQVENAVTGITNATQQLATGINESVDQAKSAIIAGADALNSNVQRLSTDLTNTSDSIEAQTEKIREQLVGTVGDISSATQEVLISLKKTGEQMLSDTKVIQHKFSDSIDDVRKKLSDDVESVFQKQTQQLNKMFQELEQTVTQMAKQAGENLADQVREIDENRRQVTSGAMTDMGKALATITTRFTTDYQKLVDEMQSVIKYRGDKK